MINSKVCNTLFTIKRSKNQTLIVYFYNQNIKRLHILLVFAPDIIKSSTLFSKIGQHCLKYNFSVSFQNQCKSIIFKFVPLRFIFVIMQILTMQHCTQIEELSHKAISTLVHSCLKRPTGPIIVDHRQDSI